MAKTAPSPLPPADPTSEEMDDYMSMTIAEPTKPAEKETYTQRRIRKQREVRPLPPPSAPPLNERQPKRLN